MWQQAVLKELGLTDLADTLTLKVERERSQYQTNPRPDLAERLWIYGLWQEHPNAYQLDLLVDELQRKTDKGQLLAEFFAIWQELPHKLVKTHWNLIRKAAATYHISTQIDNEHFFDDLISAGQEALLLAAQHFYFRQTKDSFKNLAWNTLRQKMREDQQQRHPVPAKLRKKLRHLADLRDEFKLKDIAQTPELLAESLAMSPTQVQDLLQIEAVWGVAAEAETDIELDELEKPDPAPSALSLLLAVEDRSRIQAALKQLGARSKTIIQGLYFEEKSLRILADELGVTLNAVKKAHKKALQDLKGSLD